MNTAPVSTPLWEMVPTARFYSREEADALSALALEAGITAPVVDASRAMATFDMSLGAVGSAEGFTVFVNPGDLKRLQSKLEETLEIDPQDPLCTLTDSELEEVVHAPLNANLTERVIARKLLAARKAGAQDAPALPASTTAFNPDPHRKQDVRMARWLGGVAIIFTAVYLFFIAADPGYREQVMRESIQGTWKQDSSAKDRRGYVHHDAFAGGVRVPLLFLLPFAAGGALILSRRKLADDTVRPMFPGPWRVLGWVILIVAVAGLVWFMRDNILEWLRRTPEEPPED
ncbi:MAG TPA: hypothetical protein VG796_18135 [Verrucomicrobiales bacterium]|jgi:hypothetical protein|nr:hypothetical protein [Verrucomicrobiales bacterium]